jgi:hypothetical protein
MVAPSPTPSAVTSHSSDRARSTCTAQ